MSYDPTREPPRQETAIIFACGCRVRVPVGMPTTCPLHFAPILSSYNAGTAPGNVGAFVQAWPGAIFDCAAPDETMQAVHARASGGLR